jgi:hypothetical protein
MKLWELRSYEQVIKLEQERLVYQARLRSRFGRAWRRKAPVESLMPLRLARYGVPLAETAPAGLAAAGIEPVLLPPAPAPAAELPPTTAGDRAAEAVPVPQHAAPQSEQRPVPPPSPDAEPPQYIPEPEESPWFQAAPHEVEYHGGYDPSYDPDQYPQWYEQEPPAEDPSPEETGSFPIPVSPGRTRELGEGGGTPDPTEDDYYQVFKKSIDGSYPTSGQLRDDVEATYGITLPPREAERMVNRFTNRHTAELQEDHIA